MPVTIWVGPRFSDIELISSEFVGYIVLHGGVNDVSTCRYSYNESTGEQVNINNFDNSRLINDYFETCVGDVIKREPNALFLFYGKTPLNIQQKYMNRVIFTNSPSLSRYLSDKFESRFAASLHVPVLPSTLLLGNEVSYDNLTKVCPGVTEFVIQRRLSAGGYGTFYMSKDVDCMEVFSADESVVVSPFRNNSVSINQHVIVQEKPIFLSPSVQIVARESSYFQYSGCDFRAYNSLASESKLKIAEYSQALAEWLFKIGYRGVIGFDYLVSNKGVELVEFNCRFQSSTFVLNQILVVNKLPSVQSMHLSAFSEHNYYFEFNAFDIPKNANYFSPSNGNQYCSFEYTDNLLSPDQRNSFHNKGNLSIKVIQDNYVNGDELDKGSQPIKYQFSEQICSIDYEGKVVIKPALSLLHRSPEYISSELNFGSVEPKDIAMLKFWLLSMGMRIAECAKGELYSKRDKLTIRDGIAGGLEIVLHHNVHINIPIKEAFSFISPFELRYQDGYFLAIKGDYKLPVEVVDLPSFVGVETSTGKLMESIGQVFTDRLSINPFRGCRYNKSNKKACRFCAVGSGPMTKNADIDDIFELVTYVKHNLKDSVRHVLISGGSPIPSHWDYYLDVAKRIKSVIDIPLYIMIEPPESIEQLRELYEAGVDEVGINMEFWDDGIAKDIMPGKGMVSRKQYIEFLKEAVSIWGKGGAVRSILIVGIEPIEKTLEAVTELVKIGVLPILSAFRPIPLTPLAEHPSPAPDALFRVWESAQQICESYGTTLGPTCTACQNNTITLPFGSQYHYY